MTALQAAVLMAEKAPALLTSSAYCAPQPVYGGPQLPVNPLRDAVSGLLAAVTFTSSVPMLDPVGPPYDIDRVQELPGCIWLPTLHVRGETTKP